MRCHHSTLPNPTTVSITLFSKSFISFFSASYSEYGIALVVTDGVITGGKLYDSLHTIFPLSINL